MPGGQHAAPLSSPDEIELWERITSHSGEAFTTSGRGSKPGIPFTYTIRGAEMFVSSRSKSMIFRSKPRYLQKTHLSYGEIADRLLHYWRFKPILTPVFGRSSPRRHAPASCSPYYSLGMRWMEAGLAARLLRPMIL